MELFHFFINRWSSILGLTLEHFQVIFVAMLISIAIGVLVGILITHNEKAAQVVLNVAGILMTIPSLALFAFMIPILGIGKAPAIAGLVLYTQLPIIRNVYAGIVNINPAIIEAAKGMGLTSRKIMFKIKLPLAFPVIMAGIRTAVVMGIGIGAIAAYIGAGGLGEYIFQGIGRTNDKMILIGGIMISIITVAVDKLLNSIQKRYEVY